MPPSVKVDSAELMVSCYMETFGVVVQKDLTKQEFLQGHNNRVSCVTLSRSGKYLASGQVLCSPPWPP